jgi:hypothetical protein
VIRPCFSPALTARGGRDKNQQQSNHMRFHEFGSSRKYIVCRGINDAEKVGSVAALLSAGSASAQSRWSRRILSRCSDSNLTLNRNKQAALHIERELLQCGQWIAPASG